MMFGAGSVGEPTTKNIIEKIKRDSKRIKKAKKFLVLIVANSYCRPQIIVIHVPVVGLHNVLNSGHHLLKECKLTGRMILVAKSGKLHLSALRNDGKIPLLERS